MKSSHYSKFRSMVRTSAGCGLSLLWATTLYAQEPARIAKTSQGPVNTVIDVISGFAGPIGLTFSHNGKRLYVANFSQDTISVVDTALNFVIDNSIYAGSSPYGLAVTPNGKTLYISNQLTPGTVSVLGTRTLALKTTISGIGSSPVTLAITPNQVTTTINNVKNLQSATVSALTPDGKYLYVPVFDGSSPGTVRGY